MQIPRRVLLLLVSVISAACARPALQTIALLSDSYEVVTYRHPTLRVTSYKSFLIEDVDIYSRQFSGRRDINPDQKNILAKTFWAEAIEALKGYPITDTPGPSVLRIKIRIRDVHPSHWETDENKFLILKFDTEIEHAAMEIVCRDSVSNTRILDIEQTLDGPRYFEEENEKRLGNLREAFRAWAHTLRQRLDESKKSDEEN